MFYEAVTGKIQKWLGRFGSAYVTLTDATGAPITALNPVPTSASLSLSSVKTLDSVTASDGTVIELGRYVQTFNYNGDGTVNYINVAVGAANYRQTFSYSGGAVSAISIWTLQ